MEESDIKAPLYYVIGEKADVDKVQHLLTLTPCHYGVVNTYEHKVLLQPIVQEVLQADDCTIMAEHLARSEGRPVLIIGLLVVGLKAVYSTGEEQILC